MRGMRAKFVGLTILLLSGWLTIAAIAAPVSQITQVIVFGDSLSDTGNILSRAFGFYPIAPDYDNGRFTSGPNTTPASTMRGVWHERMSQVLGAPVATRSLSNGTNWAFGGAETGAGTYTVQGVTVDNVGKQRADYLTRVSNTADPKALYIVWAGGNDLVNAAQANGATAATIATAGTNAITNLRNTIVALWNRGARNFLWPNLPPLEKTPRGQTYAAALRTAVGAAATQFKVDQTAAITALTAQFNNDVNFLPIDVHGIVNSMIQNPADYDLVNVASVSQGQNVDPDRYLFWDDLHPTARIHRLLGDVAVNTVPEPATAGTIVLVIGASLLRRARKAA